MTSPLLEPSLGRQPLEVCEAHPLPYLICTHVLRPARYALHEHEHDHAHGIAPNLRSPVPLKRSCTVHAGGDVERPEDVGLCLYMLVSWYGP